MMTLPTIAPARAPTLTSGGFTYATTDHVVVQGEDRDRARCRLRRASSGSSASQDGVDFGAGQLRRDGGKLFRAQGVSASLDDQILPFDEAEPTQLVIERREHRRLGSLIVQNAQPIAAARLLRARRVLNKAGPCVLVGHSYGGMIITETGMHPDVKGLVYVAAFQPDVGESLSDLAGKMRAAARSVGPVGDGFLAVNPYAFPKDFAADVPEPVARFMAISQVPVSFDAFEAKATVAAWKQKTSYAVISMQDRMINGPRAIHDEAGPIASH
jgi:hypothetical protein